jgi:orotidine-5'-phosphate decarboxylase
MVEGMEKVMDKMGLTPRERLVFPLDVPDTDAARRLVEALQDQVGWFKVGLELFISQGPDIIRFIKKITGDRCRLFLDLKLHDIPATVGRATAAASALGVDLLTIHAAGGREMVRAAKAAAGSTLIMAVTVLTSLDLSEDLGLAPEFTRPLNLVRLRARLAREAGCDGFVCSGQEAGEVRRDLGPDPLIITPGIRPTWSLVEGDDQKRVVTPETAIRDGADLLVVGRPIRDAADPAAAAAKVVAEIAAAVKVG